MAQRVKVWMLAVLEAVETVLFALLPRHTLWYGALLFLAFNLVAVALLILYHFHLERASTSILKQILVRVVAYKTVIMVVMATFHTFLLPHVTTCLVYTTLLFVIYIIRVCFCEYIKKNFRKRILGGISHEMLWLERYLLITRNYTRRDKRYYTQSLEGFYALGPPEPLDADYFFDVWNDRSDAKGMLERGADNFVVEIESSGEQSETMMDPNTGTALISIHKTIIARDSHSQDTYYDDESSQGGARKMPPKKITSLAIQRYFPPEIANEVFRIVSFDRGTKLDCKTFKENLSQVDKERSNLYSAIDSFHSLMLKVKVGGILLQTASSISLLLFFLEAGAFLTTMCLPVLLFLLLPSLEQIASSIFFILMSNPFNSGDRVILDKENLVVKDIAMLSTRFTRWNGEEVIVSNQKIAKSTILNVMRSASQQWKLELVVSSQMTPEKISALRTSLKKHVSSDRAFLALSLNFSELIDANFVKLIVIVKHRKNYQNGFFTWVNHNRFMTKLVSKLKKLDICYYPLDIPVMIQK